MKVTRVASRTSFSSRRRRERAEPVPGGPRERSICPVSCRIPILDELDNFALSISLVPVCQCVLLPRRSTCLSGRGSSGQIDNAPWTGNRTRSAPSRSDSYVHLMALALMGLS
jgi:hypothetical protein